MRLIALISSYREGPLIRRAIDSAFRATRHVIVFEGPAGAPLASDVPESEIEHNSDRFLVVEHGNWATDANKRTAMVKYAQRRFDDGPLWAVWVDGDEILCNGEYLPDWLQAIEWNDEQRREREIRNGEPFAPTAGFPIRLVELDGTIMVCRAKVLRIDLVANYVVSSSGIRFKNGVTMAEGNLAQNAANWFLPHVQKMEEDGRLIHPPPLPCEPFLMHRPALRHPDRVGLRLHEQELSELKKMGVLPEDYTP